MRPPHLPVHPQSSALARWRWGAIALALVAALSALLLASPRPAEARVPELLSVEVHDGVSTFDFDLPAIEPGEFVLVHAAWQVAQCITLVGDGELEPETILIAYLANEESGLLLATFLIASHTPFPGGTFTVTLHGPECEGEPLDEAAASIAVLHYRGSVRPVEGGLSASFTTGTSVTAFSMDNLPPRALVHRFVSVSDWHGAGTFITEGTCEAGISPTRIYGAPAPGGPAPSARSLAAFAVVVSGATGPFIAEYCADEEIVEPPAWIVLGYALELAREPGVTKEAIEARGGHARWAIHIDNTPHEGGFALDTQVRLTDPGVVLEPHPDCRQDGDVITCDVAAESETTLRVRSVAEPGCGGTLTNAITALEARYLDFGRWSPWEQIDPPAPATAEQPRGEGYCLPDGYVIPLPVPDPGGDPPPASDGPGGGEGDATCEVPAGVFAPAPLANGLTIATWGGGNVAGFPAATSYWTTVEGDLIGYLPGAPAWVNAAFLEVFPGGDVPACTAMIVARR